MRAAGKHGQRNYFRAAQDLGRRYANSDDQVAKINNFHQKESKRRPEERWINDYAVVQAAIGKSANAAAFLGLTLSTVILLGGFVSSLEMKDFWCLMAISMVMLSGVLTVHEYYDGFKKAIKRIYYGSCKKHLGDTSDKAYRSIGFNLKLFCFQTVELLSGLVFLPVGVVYLFGPHASIGISVMRLVQHDYGEADGAANRGKLKASLIIFYSLTLVQATLLGLWFLIFRFDPRRAARVSKECGFPAEEWGIKLVYRYIRETRDVCKEGLSLPTERNLITYAVALLQSGSREDGLAAARIFDTFTTNEKQARRALLSSKQCIQNLITMLALPSPEDAEIRERAARIVADIAGDIHVTQFPGVLQCLASLLQVSPQDQGQEDQQPSPREKKGGEATITETLLQLHMSFLKRIFLLSRQAMEKLLTKTERATEEDEQKGNEENKNNSRGKKEGVEEKDGKTTSKFIKMIMLLPDMMTWILEKDLDTERLVRLIEREDEDSSFESKGSKELILRGLEALQGLAHDPHNCAEICNMESLLSRITAPLKSAALHEADDHYTAWVAISKAALRLLSRLVDAPGEASGRLRREIAASEEAITYLENMLTMEKKGDTGLQEPTIEILTKLPLDDETRNKFIDMLAKIVSMKDRVGMEDSITQDGDHEKDIGLMKKASEALSKMRATDTTTDYPVVVEGVTNLLVRSKNIKFQTEAAEILQHLCFNFTKYSQVPKDGTINLLKTVLEQILSIEDAEKAKAAAAPPPQAGQDVNSYASGNDEENILQTDDGRIMSSNRENNDGQSERRNLLAALLSVGVVVCEKLIDADGFSTVLRDINRQADESDALMKKLKNIIDWNCYPNTSCLRIMKLTCEMAKSVMRHHPLSCTYLKKHKFEESLAKALKIMSDLDSCLLFIGNDCETMKPIRPLSSIIKEAHELFQTYPAD